MKRTQKLKAIKKASKNISEVYDRKNGLLFTNELELLRIKNLCEMTDAFQNSDTKPLFLLNSSQLTRVMCFNQKRVKKLKESRKISETREMLREARKTLNSAQPPGYYPIGASERPGTGINRTKGGKKYFEMQTKYGRFRTLIKRMGARRGGKGSGKDSSFFMTSTDQ